MKKILYATDFSDNAKNAFQYALNLSQAFGSNITAIHVQEKGNPYHAYLPNSVQEHFLKTMTQDYELFLKEAQSLRQSASAAGMPNLDVHYELKEGSPVKEIIETAEEQKSNLIVMGSKGITNLKKLFLGSNTIRVIKRSEVPVLVVPEGVTFRNIERVALALPPREWEEGAIMEAQDFAKKLKAKLICFSVVPPDEIEKIERLKQKMDIYQFEFRNNQNIEFHAVEDYNLFAGIRTFLKEQTIDLLGIHYIKKSRIEHFFGGNHVEDITLGTNMPLLIIK